VIDLALVSDAAAYGDAFADVYDEWYADVSDVDGTVERIAALAGGTAVLELGVGTGRIAAPLAARGVAVHGIDASDAMLRRLSSRPGGAGVRVWRGDMADLDLPGAPPFGVVFAAFNTFCNLADGAQQRRCLARSAALLAPDGCVVLETYVPADDVPAGRVLEVAAADERGLVIHASTTDHATQVVDGRHIVLCDGRATIRPWRIRYVTIDELDAMAADAGLVLESRHGGWRGERFDANATCHVSVWRRRYRRDVLRGGSHQQPDVVLHPS
jgi:SAM-dependent methyltransferase